VAQSLGFHLWPHKNTDPNRPNKIFFFCDLRKFYFFRLLGLSQTEGKRDFSVHYGEGVRIHTGEKSEIIDTIIYIYIYVYGVKLVYYLTESLGLTKFNKRQFFTASVQQQFCAECFTMDASAKMWNVKLFSTNLTTSQKENINFTLIVGKVYFIASSNSVTENVIKNPSSWNTHILTNQNRNLKSVN